MKRTFACSDLHGQLDLWKQIKNFLNPEDTVYFLGDAGDRGPDGWELIKAIANDSQVIYLKGNHEDMLVKAIRSWNKYECQTKEVSLCWHNGGYETMQGLMAESPEGQAGWVKFLDNLPLVAHYINTSGINIRMSHAGYTPHEMVLPSSEDLIWNRDHFLDEWDDDFNNSIIVHGHTPIPYLADDLLIKTTEPGAFWYCDNHKVCIDNAALWSNTTCLFDLDTFDEHIFSIGETRWM